MFTMMESLEGRQMFSVASPESTALATPDVAVDTAPPTEDAAAKPSPALFRACATGTHYKTVTLDIR